MTYFKEEDKHSTEILNNIFLRRILFLQDAETRKVNEVEQGELGEEGEEDGEEE